MGGGYDASAQYITWTENDTTAFVDLNMRRMMSDHEEHVKSKFEGHLPKYLEDRKNRPLSVEEEMKRVMLEDKMKHCLEAYVPKVQDLLRGYDVKIGVEVIHQGIKGDLPVLFVRVQSPILKENLDSMLAVLKGKIKCIMGISQHELDSMVSECEIKLELLDLMHGFDDVS